MKTSTQPYKGTRDFYPEDARVQNMIFSAWSKVAEAYGYEMVEASVLEPLDLYRLKNQTNAEIVNEQMYTLTDRGDREVALRPEMTPTVSRMVAARRQELGYPLRWYSIPNLFRYERPQKGRLREHWQLNVDIFGVDSMAAEQELITLACDMLRKFGATDDMYTVQLNSRALMNEIFTQYLKLPESLVPELSQLIDRKAKMPTEDFSTKCQELTGDASERLLQILEITDLSELPKDVQLSMPAIELNQLMQLLQAAGVNNAYFDITIMRGFDYYTGVVFEMVNTDPDNNRAMFGGGRYDGLVGAFGVEPVPTVGFGMGDVTFRDFLESNNLFTQPVTETDVYVVLVGDVYEQALPVFSRLRTNGLNVAVDTSGKKLAKQIDTAAKKGVELVLFVGNDELEAGEFKLKNINSGEEFTLNLDELEAKLA